MLHHYDPVALFERATARAARGADPVRPGQLADPTPCAEWSVQDLVEHMVGVQDYLLGATGARARAGVRRPRRLRTTARVSRACSRPLGRPGALDRNCRSPLGFEWSVAEATAGTFMDNLVHTWDLATATGQNPPARRRAGRGLRGDVPSRTCPSAAGPAGIVGLAVTVPPGASAQDRLLGAMGRQP